MNNQETTRQSLPNQTFCTNPTDVRRDVYYQVSFAGAAHAHEKYQTLKAAIEKGIPLAKAQAPALSSEFDDLAHWATMPGGFTCQHTPWRIIIPCGDLYRAFIYVLRVTKDKESDRLYHQVRSYGTWV